MHITFSMNNMCSKPENVIKPCGKLYQFEDIAVMPVGNHSTVV
jgi:hypothetical protein